MLDAVSPRWPRGLGWPSLLLASALVLSGLGAWLVLDGRPRAAGGAALAAVVAVLAGARGAAGRERFAALVVDRLAEAALLAPLAWAWRGSPRLGPLVLASLGVSYLAAYERARGRSLGYRFSDALGFRATGGGLVAAALLTGLVEPLLWSFAILSAAAAVARGVSVRAQDRRGSRAEPLPGR